MTNIISSSMKTAWDAVRKHKMIFAVILIMQVIFLSAWFANQFYFQQKINEGVVNVMDRVQSNLPPEEKISTAILSGESLVSDDFLDAANLYDSVISDVRLWLIVSAVIFALLNGLVWGFTGKILNRGFVAYYPKFIAASVAYFALIILFFQLALASISVNPAELQNTFTSKSYLFIAASIVVLYFMPVSFSLIANKGLKELPRQTLLIGIKKFPGVLLLYIACILLIAIPMALMIAFTENIYAVISGTVLLILAISYARISFMAGIHSMDS